MNIRHMARAAAAIACFCWLIAASAPGRAQETTRSLEKDKKAIQSLEARLAVAFVKKDLPFLASVIADDAINIGSDGASMKRNDYLALVTKDRAYSIYTNKAMAARMYSNVAIVHGPEHVEGVFGGWHGSVDVITTRVWAYRANKWQIVLWQSTNPPPASNHPLQKWLHG